MCMCLGGRWKGEVRLYSLIFPFFLFLSQLVSQCICQEEPLTPEHLGFSLAPASLPVYDSGYTSFDFPGPQFTQGQTG